MILQAPTTTLGATENEEAIPWECQNGNYRELIGSNHGHRFYDYSGSSKDNIHENNPQYSVGYDNWFRFRLKEATRMLEGNELDKNLNHVKMVCICSVFSLLMQKKLCQILIIYRLIYFLEPRITGLKCGWIILLSSKSHTNVLYSPLLNFRGSVWKE